MRHSESLEWAKGFECVWLWLSKRQQQLKLAFWLWRFCEWSQLDPERLLDLKRKGNDFQAEKLLDRFVAEMPFKNSVIWNMVNTVKSFFKHNYLDLVGHCGRIDLVKVKPYYNPNKIVLRRVYRAAQNPRDRCMVMFACSAIARETLARVKWANLEVDWEKQTVPHVSIGSEILKGHGKGKWKDVRQETFLTPEAKEELMFYREWLTFKRKREPELNEQIFVSVQQPWQPLSLISLNHIIEDISRRAEVNFTWHDGRRFLQTNLEAIGVNPNWIQKFKGRKVKGEQRPYSQPEIEKLRGKFQEALPQLCFIQEENENTKNEIRELKQTLGEETLEHKRHDAETEALRSELADLKARLKRLEDLGVKEWQRDFEQS